MVKYMKRHFTIKEIAVSNKQRNRCSISLIIREIQVKTTMKHYYISIRMINFFFKENLTMPITLISHATKVMLKILQARLQHYVN